MQESAELLKYIVGRHSAQESKEQLITLQSCSGSDIVFPRSILDYLVGIICPFKTRDVSKAAAETNCLETSSRINTEKDEV